MTDRQIVRFWEQVRKSDECWLWTGCVSGGKYGRTRNGARYDGAHRVAWELANGREVPDDMCVMHSCDRMTCVRPDHLSIGTLADNCRDRHRKGRDAKGIQNWNTKLSADNVRAIRAALAAGEAKRALARRYDVDFNAIHYIAIGRTHKDVP